MLWDHYAYRQVVDKCVDQEKPDVELLKKFELTTDLANLPDDRRLKCFMSCSLIEYGIMKVESNSYHPIEFLEVMNQMELSEQRIFLKMGGPCAKKKFKDPCEMGYQMNVCMKKNDNEHYYLFYNHDYLGADRSVQ